MATVNIDASELRTLAADMRAIDGRLSRHVRPAVERGANNIKRTMRADADASRHFHFSRAINYDLRTPGDMFEAEIGPEKGRPGSIANIAYFGTSRGGGTVRDPAEAANEELPNFEKALAELAADLVFG